MSSLYIQNLKILAGLCSWEGKIVYCLVGDSRNHILMALLKCFKGFGLCTYNITSCGATGTEFHSTFEEHVVTIVELEDVEVHVVTFDQRNAVVHGVKISTE